MDLCVHLQTKEIPFIRASDVQPQTGERTVLDALDRSRLKALLDNSDHDNWPVVSPGRYALQLAIHIRRIKTEQSEFGTSIGTIDRILYEIYALETAQIWKLERNECP